MSLCTQKSKGTKAAEPGAVDTVEGGAIAAVSADAATDPVVIVKESADSPAMLVSPNGNAEQVNLEQTASGELRALTVHLAIASSLLSLEINLVESIACKLPSRRRLATEFVYSAMLWAPVWTTCVIDVRV